MKKTTKTKPLKASINNTSIKNFDLKQPILTTDRLLCLFSRSLDAVEIYKACVISTSDDANNGDNNDNNIETPFIPDIITKKARNPLDFTTLYCKQQITCSQLRFLSARMNQLLPELYRIPVAYIEHITYYIEATKFNDTDELIRRR